MKRLLTTALLGLASVALIATNAKAQEVTTPTGLPNTGDLVLGFKITDDLGQGANDNLMVDFGNIGATGILTAAPGTTISLNAISPTLSGLAVQDLISTFGADWASRTDLAWGLFAASGSAGATTVSGYPVGTVWADENPSLVGYESRYHNLQQAASAEYQPMVVAGLPPSSLFGATATANSASSAVVNSTLAGSWTYQQTPPTSPTTQFSLFNGTPMDVFEGGPLSSPTVADFYHLIPQTGPNQTAPAILLGTFSLASNGNFTYTAVPEPNSMGLMGVGFLSLIGLVVLRHRRSIVA